MGGERGSYGQYDLEKMTTSWAETVDFTKDLGEGEADPNAARAMNAAAAAAAATPIRRPSNATIVCPAAGEVEMRSVRRRGKICLGEQEQSTGFD
jgi:hypothetical protein